MKKHLPKLKSLGIGFVLVLVIGLVLTYMDKLLIGPSEYVQALFVFVFWWLLTAIATHQILRYKQKKKLLIKIALLIALLSVLMVVDSYMDTPDNPITIGLLIVFWMGVAYVLIPSFIEKYRLPLIGVYVLVLLHFFYVRIFSENISIYMQEYKERALLLLVLPIPLFLALWFYEQWRWLQSLKAEKAAAELAMLRSQVNPHFFFNTLNNLYSLTVSNSPKAPEVILKLSEMMRYTIYEGKNESVALKDEVAYLEHYIELHRIRYHKKVQIDFDYAIEEGTRIAPLLFIILLENAIKHGVEKIRKGAFIKMRLENVGQEIRFSIQNNFEEEEREESQGIGLENLKRRLDLLYPNSYKLSIKQKEDVFSAELLILMEVE